MRIAGPILSSRAMSPAEVRFSWLPTEFRLRQHGTDRTSDRRQPRGQPNACADRRPATVPGSPQGAQTACGCAASSPALLTVPRSDVVGRAAAAGLIDHVDGIALPQEVLSPAVAPVGRLVPAGADLAATVNQHDRDFLAIVRNLILHVHLADHATSGVERATDEEVALLDGDDGLLAFVSGARGERGRDERRGRKGDQVLGYLPAKPFDAKCAEHCSLPFMKAIFIFVAD